MNLENALKELPDTKGVVVVLSGGMDSTIAMRLCVQRYGANNVRALTFDYGQKQKIEIEKAKISTSHYGVKHKIFDLSASRLSPRDQSRLRPVRNKYILFRFNILNILHY